MSDPITKADVKNAAEALNRILSAHSDNRIHMQRQQDRQRLESDALIRLACRRFCDVMGSAAPARLELDSGTHGAPIILDVASGEVNQLGSLQGGQRGPSRRVEADLTLCGMVLDAMREWLSESGEAVDAHDVERIAGETDAIIAARKLLEGTV